MKKRDGEKYVSLVIWIAMLVLAGDIVLKGLSLDAGTWCRMMKNVQQHAIEVYLPQIVRTGKGETLWLRLWKGIEEQIPFLERVPENEEQTMENEEISTKIIRENSEFLKVKLLEENKETEKQQAEAEAVQAKAEEASVGKPQARMPVTDIPLEKFQDFEFVMKSFYTVDKTTSITGEQLNAPELVQMDMRMKAGRELPQILIYHSHSQEGFIDSVPGDASTHIVGVGEYLCTLLRDTYGYQVMHVTDSFDMVNGSLDRNQAYTYAKEKISKILEENPSIEVVIDLHRDGVAADKRLVTDINGKDTAKIMFFNGLSRTRQNGEIDYLKNPYIRENLAFSLQMMLEAKKYYPDWARTIYLRGYRYNLHLRPKTLLVECGAQTNTVQEEMNAMEPLADILNKVLTGA